jgi:hypothetical protein
MLQWSRQTAPPDYCAVARLALPAAVSALTPCPATDCKRSNANPAHALKESCDGHSYSIEHTDSAQGRTLHCHLSQQQPVSCRSCWLHASTHSASILHILGIHRNQACYSLRYTKHILGGKSRNFDCALGNHQEGVGASRAADSAQPPKTSGSALPHGPTSRHSASQLTLPTHILHRRLVHVHS